MLLHSQTTGAKWAYINGYRDVFASKHCRAASLIETYDKRLRFIQHNWLPCGADADAATEDAAEAARAAICPTVLLELAGIGEDENASIFSSGGKRNAFVEFCAEHFESVALSLHEDAETATAVNASQVFIKLGSMWREQQLSKRDELRRNGLASLSEAFGWKGCALISAQAVRLLERGGKNHDSAVFSWEDDGTGDDMFGKCTVLYALALTDYDDRLVSFVKVLLNRHEGFIEEVGTEEEFQKQGHCYGCMQAAGEHIAAHSSVTYARLQHDTTTEDGRVAGIIYTEKLTFEDFEAPTTGRLARVEPDEGYAMLHAEWPQVTAAAKERYERTRERIEFEAEEEERPPLPKVCYVVCEGQLPKWAHIPRATEEITAAEGEAETDEQEADEQEAAEAARMIGEGEEEEIGDDPYATNTLMSAHGISSTSDAAACLIAARMYCKHSLDLVLDLNDATLEVLLKLTLDAASCRNAAKSFKTWSSVLLQLLGYGFTDVSGAPVPRFACDRFMDKALSALENLILSNWNASDDFDHFKRHFVPRLWALLNCEQRGLMVPRIQPMPRLVVASVDADAPDPCFGPPPELSRGTMADIDKWTTPLNAKVWAVVDGRLDDNNVRRPTECIARHRHKVRMVVGSDAGAAAKAGRKPKDQPMLFNRTQRKDTSKFFEIVVVVRGSPLNQLKARFAKVPGGSTPGRFVAHQRLAQMASHPSHAAAFVNSTREPEVLEGEELERFLKEAAEAAARAEAEAAARAEAAEARDRRAEGNSQPRSTRRTRGGTVAFTRNTAAKRVDTVQKATERQRAASGAPEEAKVWACEHLRNADFRMTDILAHMDLDWEKEVDGPTLFRWPVVPTRDDTCCPDAAWGEFPFLARFCFCQTHAKMRGTESNHGHIAQDEIAAHARAAKNKSAVDRHVNPVLRRMGMRPITRDPKATPKACFAYTCDGKQADAWIGNFAKMEGVDLDAAFESGEIESTYLKGLYNCVMELRDPAAKQERLNRLKALAVMCRHYALGMRVMGLLNPTADDFDEMDMQLTQYLALKMELIGKLTVYDQWLYNLAGQMGREFRSLLANSAECMEGTQKDLNRVMASFQGFGNTGRKPDAVKADGPYCEEVYMKARAADQPPSEQKLFDARLSKWVSHHDEFFTKLRTLVEVRTILLQQWWRTYMLLCIYVLRAVVATMRRKLAFESGSTYYPRLLEEYHAYWQVAPIEPSAVWARHRGRNPPNPEYNGVGIERHHQALSLALLTKCAHVADRRVSPNPPHFRECCRGDWTSFRTTAGARSECKPFFLKEEWDALRATELRVNDFIKSGDHYYVLVKLGCGDNKAARGMKRNARRAWYKGESVVNSVRCERLVLTCAREEAATEAVRAKRAAQRARAQARRAAAHAQTAGGSSRGRREARGDSDPEDSEEEDIYADWDDEHGRGFDEDDEDDMDE